MKILFPTKRSVRLKKRRYSASRATRLMAGIDSSISGRKSPLKVASSHADVCAAVSAEEKASLSSSADGEILSRSFSSTMRRAMRKRKKGPTKIARLRTNSIGKRMGTRRGRLGRVRSGASLVTLVPRQAGPVEGEPEKERRELGPSADE